MASVILLGLHGKLPLSRSKEEQKLVSGDILARWIGNRWTSFTTAIKNKMVRQKVILDMLIFKNIYENDFEGLGMFLSYFFTLCEVYH